tara:strand:+ start:10048 stop:10242 length:195 start_codon:yes stop_codon:yes gene_type:complete
LSIFTWRLWLFGGLWPELNRRLRDGLFGVWDVRFFLWYLFFTCVWRRFFGLRWNVDDIHALTAT